MEGERIPSKMLKNTERSFVDVTKKDIHLLKKFQRDHRKVILELKTFFDEDIERGLEIKSGRPLVMPIRKLKSCNNKITSRGIEIDVELNINELYERLKKSYGKEYLETQFRENDCDLDLTYQVCVMKSAKEFTDHITQGEEWVSHMLLFISDFFGEIYEDSEVMGILKECDYDIIEFKRLVKEWCKPSTSIMDSNVS